MCLAHIKALSSSRRPVIVGAMSLSVLPTTPVAPMPLHAVNETLLAGDMMPNVVSMVELVIWNHVTCGTSHTATQLACRRARYISAVADRCQLN